MSRITSVQEVLTQLREFWGDELICGMRIGELLTLPIALPSCFRDLQQRARASTFDIAAPFYQKHILDLRLGVARKFGIPPDNLILKNRHMFIATNVFKSDLA